MNSMNIEIPKGYGIDVDESNLETGEIVFKEVERKLPKSMVELRQKLGDETAYCSHASGISSPVRASSITGKDLYPSPEMVNAAHAIADLSMLRDYYRNGWKPDWADGAHYKHVISFYGDEAITERRYASQKFLAFETEAQRDHFLKHHEELILQAMPILGG